MTEYEYSTITVPLPHAYRKAQRRAKRRLKIQNLRKSFHPWPPEWRRRYRLIVAIQKDIRKRTMRAMVFGDDEDLAQERQAV